MDRKLLRKAMSPAGWSMLLYFIIVNICVTLWVAVESLIRMILEMGSGNIEAFTDAMEAAANSAWGYFLAAGVGILILLGWKKPKFWREQIWAKGKPMKPGDFLGILSIFLAGQFIYQFLVIGLELLLNSVGLTMLEGLESMSAGRDTISMFLYVGVLAPITEELLCRGLVQRTLMPFGKRLAILGSAFLFGIFHGNIVQAPYAFAVGLVLGYVAAEYSIAWAMLLHMINNLVIGDMLTRLTQGLPEMAYGLIIWGILLVFAVIALVTLILKRHEAGAWLRRNPIRAPYARCFFGSAGVITFTVVMVLSMIGTCFILFTPLY